MHKEEHLVSCSNSVWHEVLLQPLHLHCVFHINLDQIKGTQIPSSSAGSPPEITKRPRHLHFAMALRGHKKGSPQMHMTLKYPPPLVSATPLSKLQ